MSGLAIVEKKPPFAGGGCAGGVLLHLLDWHRRLARKRRLFSPRRLLPSSLRSSPRKLPSPSPATPTAPVTPPSPPPTAAAAPPGVVARLMGLESWPASAGGASRPQKQRKVEAEAVVAVVPRRRPPAASRSHHGVDLPARSPRRSRLVQAAAAKLLEPSARATSRASARLALAYASSSPQRRDDGRSGILDGFSFDGVHSRRLGEVAVSPGDSLSVDRSTRKESTTVTVDTTWGSAVVGAWSHEKHSDDAAVGRGGTVVVPRTNIVDGNFGRGSLEADAVSKDRHEGTNSSGGIRSGSVGDRTGHERLLRKRGPLTRPELAASVRPGSSVSSARPAIGAHELVSSNRRMAHNESRPRRNSIGSMNAQESVHRCVINRSGFASSSMRVANSGSGLKRESRKKVGCDAAGSARKGSNTVTFPSSSSTKPVSRASSCSKISDKGRCRGTQVSDAARTKTPLLDGKCIETSSSDVATSERDEFGRLLKAKIKELGLSDRKEFASGDALPGKLTASVLQELISALTDDMNTLALQNCSYSDASAPSNDGTVSCIDPSGYAVPNDQSPPNFHKYYQDEQEVDSPATCMNNEGNQPSPTSILEACFSNDASSMGSPTAKTEGKYFFGLMENKMEDLFNLESDIENLAISIDTPKTDAGVHDRGKTSYVRNFAAYDFKFLETRLSSIREAISNAELLLDSSFLFSTNGASGYSLHSFVIGMLETAIDVFGGSERGLGLAEEKDIYQLTNFLFDCIVESLNSRFCNFGKCGYNAWLRTPLTLSKDLIEAEIFEEIRSWREMRGTIPNRVAEEELNHLTAKWDGRQVEAFDISIEVENDIIEALLREFTFDQW